MQREEQEARIQEILSQIRPYLQADGSDCELDRLEDGVAYVRLTSERVASSSAMMTLLLGIERRILESMPELAAVRGA